MGFNGCTVSNGEDEKEKNAKLEDVVFVSIENYSKKEEWNFKVMGNVQGKKRKRS